MKIHLVLRYFQVTQEDGVWGLHISKVGHEDAGLYECQTNSEVKDSIAINVSIMGKRKREKENLRDK